LGLRDAALLERIREGTLYGKPIGGEEFLDRIEREFHVEARRRRPGRPRLDRKPSFSEVSAPTPAIQAAG
jgi:hypothetical protein